MNYSFWADEANLSGIALQLVQGKISILQTIAYMPYQKLYVLLLSLFFKLFGTTELIARLPSFIFFLIGIFILFNLTRRLSNTYGAVLSSFLYFLSHLTLSYAAQAKPYTILGTITLFVLLLIHKLHTEKNRAIIYIYNMVIITTLSIAVLFHSIGVLMWMIYFAYLLFSIKWSSLNKINSSQIYSFLLFIIALTGLFYLFIFPIILPTLRVSNLLPYNHIYQILKLFAYKYAVITLFASLGYFWSMHENSRFNLVILLFTISVLLSTSQQYIFNIRYVFPLFGIMFLYFGVFWAKVGERYDKQIVLKFKGWKVTGRAIIPIAVMLLIYITGYKIVRVPQAYYNPNIDKYGDVQIANYKDFYTKLKAKFPNYKNLYIVNDTFDAEYWYMGRYSNAYFMKFAEKPYKHGVVGVMIYGSLADFKTMMKKHPQGLLIMEDWQSFLPDDIKEYAKKNLRLEFRVESLKEAPDDPWPLALYSWGFNDVKK